MTEFIPSNHTAGKVSVEAGENEGRKVGLTVCDDFGSHSRNFLKIVLSTSRDPSEEDLFTHSTSKGHTHSVDELLSRVEVSLTVSKTKGKSHVSFPCRKLKRGIASYVGRYWA